MNNWQDFEKNIQELKYYYDYVQQVRTLLFWAVEPGESRDKLGMKILAEYTLDWIKQRPKRLRPDAEKYLTELCNEMLESGTTLETPLVLNPIRIDIRTG